MENNKTMYFVTCDSWDWGEAEAFKTETEARDRITEHLCENININYGWTNSTFALFKGELITTAKLPSTPVIEWS